MDYFKRMSILGKMLFFIVIVSVVIYTVSFTYTIVNLRKKTFEDATQLANTAAKEYANLVTNELNYDFNLSLGLGWAFKGFDDLEHEAIDDIYNEILEIFIESNPNFFSTWVSWELNAILDDYYLPYGRARHSYFLHEGRVDYQTDTLELEGDDESSLYYQIKVNKEKTITDPYWYSFTGLEEDMHLMVSPCIPLLINDDFAGLVGTDIILERFQELVTAIKPFDVGYTFLLSNNGTFVGHPNETLLGKNITDIDSGYVEDFNIIEQIREGAFFTHIREDSILDSEAYIAYAPITNNDFDTNWSLGVVIPSTFIMEEADRILFNSVMAGISGLLVLIIIIYIIAKNITKPLKVTTNVLQTIAKGDILNAKKLEVKTDDELGQIAKALNSLVDSLKHTADFAKQIGEGNLDTEFELQDKNDLLGNALLGMRDSLIKAEKEEEKRKEEDRKRSWATQGYSMFADILRHDNDSLEDLSFNVIKNLVKYLNANQGGIFILNDDDPKNKFLELKACYAFDRKKYLEKTIQPGEGLVGATFLEHKTTYLVDVPQDYIHITSGLGGENPDCILIVPLIVNEEALGVVEIASFNAFEKHEIEFVEKVAESIASTISSAKINAKTAYLLEQSQQQAEEMRAQEEEMRQNMEEMHATQEEMARKEKELREQVELTDQFLLKMEYDTNGKILHVNDLYAKISGYSKSELIGKHHSLVFDNPNFEKSKNYQKFWDLMKKGESSKGVFKRIGKNNKVYIGKGISYPIIDDDGNFVKVIELSVDITDTK